MRAQHSTGFLSPGDMRRASAGSLRRETGYIHTWIYSGKGKPGFSLTEKKVTNKEGKNKMNPAVLKLTVSA